MPDTIEFNASLFRLTTDSEGETKLILAIPLSDLAAAVRMTQWIQADLLVSVQKA